MPESPDLPAADLLITGATGFLGGAVTRALLHQGVPAARIRCLVRDPDRAAAAGLPAASLHRGDLAADDAIPALASAAAGVGLVLHCAAAVKARGPSGFRAVNVEGTARLLQSLRAVAPGAHLVLVSSLAAAGPSVDGAGSAAMPADCRPVSAYGASKLEAERLVAGATQPWTIVRPPVVYGVGDAATRLLFRQARRPFAAVPWQSRPLSVIHVDDVTEAVLRALAVRPHGVVLPLDGPERTDTHAFVHAIATAWGRRTRLVPVPDPVAALAAAACDVFATITRTTGYFNRDKVREIRACGWVADGAAARATLGFTPRIGLAAGLAAVAAAEGLQCRVTSATA